MITNWFLIKQSWMHIVYLEELISNIEKRIDEILINYKEEVEILVTMPGIKKDTVAVIIAEIGVDNTISNFQAPCVMHGIVTGKS